MFWLLEAFNKISLVNTIPLPCNRTLWPCHYSEGRILNPEATWMFLGRRCRLPDQGGWCSCIYHCHDCRECNKTSSPMIWNKTMPMEYDFIFFCWPDFRVFRIWRRYPETNSGEIKRVERINEIILMNEHLQSTDSIYRYSEFGTPIGSCHM